MAIESEGPGYRAQLIQDLPPESIEDENADVHVELSDGRRFSGVIATMRNLEYLFGSFADQDECAQGTYVWIKYMVIAHDLAEDTIKRTLDDLVATDDIAHAFAAAE